MNLLLLFIVLNVVNVVLQTIRSIATVKCGRGLAALANAIAYGLYTVVIVYTTCELALWAKVAVVALTNLAGVFVVKTIEQKIRKDKLWVVTAITDDDYKIWYELDNEGLDYIGQETEKGQLRLEIFCRTQDESRKAKEVLSHFSAKYFVTESKAL